MQSRINRLASVHEENESNAKSLGREAADLRVRLEKASQLLAQKNLNLKEAVQTRHVGSHLNLAGFGFRKHYVIHTALKGLVHIETFMRNKDLILFFCMRVNNRYKEIREGTLTIQSLIGREGCIDK